MGPQTEVGEAVHTMKYRERGESFSDAMNRVAGALSEDPKHYRQLREVLLSMRFLPAGRIQSAMGSARSTTAYNCFVSGTIDDSFTEGSGSIMQRAVEAATTMRMGGGIGYDFSTLRPRGALIRKLGSQSSGPVSFMKIFDSVCGCVSSAGHRRGAQMGVLRVDHPDIMEFINAKRDESSLTNFNISVAVTDDFMQALQRGGDYHLRHGGEWHGTASARSVWDAIMRSTWEWAEPGVLFIDTINRLNNLWYCEHITATNPCAEQPLPPYGACLLGSFNLTQYVYRNHNTGRYEFAMHQLMDDIPIVVRAMDNVVDRARYPLREQELEAKGKRRMGLGVTGVANALEGMGYSYGSPDFCSTLDEILAVITREAYRASAILAEEKGSFTMYNESSYLDNDHSFVATRLDDETKDMIRAHGIRNSHLTSIAPTGTISLCADNVSSSIEPVWSLSAKRKINTPTGQELMLVEDWGHSNKIVAKTTQQVTIDEHLAVLEVASRNVDSAVSKTLNCSDDITWEDFQAVYITAWKGGAKGCTTYRPAGSRVGIMEEAPPEGQSCTIDPVTGSRTCE